ncbi:MAG: hypothetical protein IKG47_02705 [Oscillospiraceae bacterium]|nr:hypothetical protein [Oscillospiraceae bacterium]
MTSETFSGILIQLMDGSRMNLRKAHDMLKEKGIQVSYQSLAAYKAFTGVPAYDKAQAILTAFDYPIEESELFDILENSRDRLKEMNQDSRKYLQRSIRINPNLFNSDMTVEALELLLEQRIEELGENTVNAYVSNLIKKDLIESGYIEAA